MNSEVQKLRPNKVWQHFEELNAVPRPSKKEGRVLQFLKEFASGLDLPYEQDEIGNLVVRKPATAGMENRRPVILQAHVDMVHQKNSDTDFDFETEGIRSRIEGDWVKAEGTTLGADNGMGVAAIMAVLSSNDVAHPPLEALFTVDEEAGMTGAQKLKHNWLKGEILMNLDTEDDDELSIGCAGGVDINIEGNYEEEEALPDWAGYEIKVRGLRGGHSGMDIILGLGNANKIMNRLLLAAHGRGARVAGIDGGGLRNAIPRESTAQIAVHQPDSHEMLADLDAAIAGIEAEFATTDPGCKISYTSISPLKKVMAQASQKKWLLALQCCPDGIRRLSPDVEDLVETSNNVARVLVQEGKVEIKCLTRSDRESGKWDMARSVGAAFELAGAEVIYSGSYPGWKMDPQAPMLEMMKELYEELFHEKPRVLACHAGLECGLLGKHYPNLEMISFGPTIKGPHSPDERVNIPSVAKFWGYFTEALKRIPEKAR